MSTTTKNNAEGGSNGTAVTTANSGGTSGDAWNNVTTSGSATLNFSTTQAMHGLLSYAFGCAGLTTCFLTRSFTTAVANCGSRFYFFNSSSLSSSTFSLCSVQSSGGLTNFVQIKFITSSGQFKVINSAGTTIFTSSGTYSTDTWYRIEFTVDSATSTTTGNLNIKIFAGDSTTPIETGQVLNSNFGSTNLGQIVYGVYTATSGATGTYYLDDISEIDTNTFLGPAVTHITVSRTVLWNTKVQVVPTRTLLWNTKGTITPTRTLLWNTKGTISPTRTLKWNTDKAISLSRTLLWNVTFQPRINRIILWNTKQTIVPTYTLLWNTRFAVAVVTRTLLWNTRLTVSLLRILLWNTKQTIIPTRTLLWNTKGTITTTRTLLWRVTGHLIVIRTILWETFAPWTAYTKVCGPWTSINQNTVGWSTQPVSSNTWR